MTQIDHEKVYISTYYRYNIHVIIGYYICLPFALKIYFGMSRLICFRTSPFQQKYTTLQFLNYCRFIFVDTNFRCLMKTFKLVFPLCPRNPRKLVEYKWLHRSRKVNCLSFIKLCIVKHAFNICIKTLSYFCVVVLSKHVVNYRCSIIKRITTNMNSIIR